MLKAAITGNIGSGKSIVTRIFQVLGVPVFIADIEAKKLYELPDIKNQVRELFGDAIFDKNDELIKQALAEIIFNDKSALKKVNNIIHPRTLERYSEWLLENAGKPYTLHESAILFENGLAHHFDTIINVTAPFDVRLKRVVKRDKIEEALVIERMKNQMSDEEKSKMANFVIINDGKTFIIPQVIEIHEKLLKH